MSKRILVVEDQADSQAEADEEMITFNIPDEALERAASADRQLRDIRRNPPRLIFGEQLGR